MSVPAGLMEALQGGSPDAGYGPPPDAYNAPVDAGYAPQDAAPTQDPGMSAEELLQQGIEILQAALQKESDPQDSQALAEIVKQLYAIIADRQKAQDSALQGKMDPRMLRRAG